MAGQWRHNYRRNWYANSVYVCDPESSIILGKYFSTSLCILVDFFTVMEFDCLALELQQLFSVSQWKTAILCGQLPNVMFLYIILHMAVKLSRHGCQCFA